MCRYTMYNRSLLYWLLIQASNSKAAVTVIDAFALAETCDTGGSGSGRERSRITEAERDL